MKREIEFHDSTLKEIKFDAGNAVICFDEAFVHQSEGILGIDAGTDWAQKINIMCTGVSVIEIPDDLPNDIDYGYFVIKGEKTTNMMKLPFSTKDEIEIILFTQYGKKLHLIAKSATSQEMGSARYIQEFTG